MRKGVLLFILLCFAPLLNAAPLDAHEIIKKVDKNMRGNTIYMQIAMKITAFGHERTMKMKIWAAGKKRSFVKIIYPPKERGITFLNLDNQMWQYIPKIERTIKIPPSMMLQNWMGSDITNDDMVKQSSIVDDYDAKLLKREGKIVTIELIPHEDAAVVWGKIISRIDTSTYTDMQDVYYDEDGKKVRIFTYKNVKKVGKYFLPMYWKVTPVDEKDHYTELRIEDVKYDLHISEQYFKKSALKRFSR